MAQNDKLESGDIDNRADTVPHKGMTFILFALDNRARLVRFVVENWGAN
jgi:hypothetical protein